MKNISEYYEKLLNNKDFIKPLSGDEIAIDVSKGGTNKTMPEYMSYTSDNSDEIFPSKTDIDEQSYRPEVPKVPAKKAVVKQPIHKGSTYKVKAGDTVSKIAQRYGISIEELKKLNNLKNINRIYIGDELNIGNSETTPNNKNINNSIRRGGINKKLNEITVSYDPKTKKGVSSTQGLPDYHWGYNTYDDSKTYKKNYSRDFLHSGQKNKKYRTKN